METPYPRIQEWEELLADVLGKHLPPSLAEREDEDGPFVGKLADALAGELESKLASELASAYYAGYEQACRLPRYMQ